MCSTSSINFPQSPSGKAVDNTVARKRRRVQYKYGKERPRIQRSENEIMFRAFVHKLPERFLAVYRGNSIFYHIAAVVLTYVLVVSGFDWYFFEVTRSPYFYPLTMAAGIGGFFVPVLVPIGMYLLGEIRKNTSLIAHGALCAQAIVIAWVVTSFYKALTGGIDPEFLPQTSFLDGCRDFNFGPLQQRLFWGWRPS